MENSNKVSKVELVVVGEGIVGIMLNNIRVAVIGKSGALAYYKGANVTI